jgi:hypothetical protein
MVQAGAKSAQKANSAKIAQNGPKSPKFPTPLPRQAQVQKGAAGVGFGQTAALAPRKAKHAQAPFGQGLIK